MLQENLDWGRFAGRASWLSSKSETTVAALFSLAGQVVRIIIIVNGEYAFDDSGPGFGSDDEEEAKKKARNSFRGLEWIRELLDTSQKHQNWSRDPCEDGSSNTRAGQF